MPFYLLSLPPTVKIMHETTLSVLLGLAVADAVLHTLAGPDHYLPFVMIAKSRGYSILRALAWTFVCGIGHVGSALLIALVFMYASHLLTESDMEWLNENRGDLAAWALIGFGAAYMIYAMRHNWLHHHHRHAHGHELIHNHAPNITPWIIFIIFVLGPCEALLPLLAPAAALGSYAVALVTIAFSICTIATMMLAVALGLKGLSLLRFAWLESHSGEVAGATIMLCGVAIAFFGL